MKRIYHPWNKWECCPAGFWKSIDSRKKDERIEAVVRFFTDEDGLAFDITCNNLIYDWVNSCEHNLTNTELNRIAWLGQASAAKALGVDCYITREAWSHLSKEVQQEANKIAVKYLKEWEMLNVIEKIPRD